MSRDRIENFPGTLHLMLQVHTRLDFLTKSPYASPSWGPFVTPPPPLRPYLVEVLGEVTMHLFFGGVLSHSNAVVCQRLGGLFYV